MTRHLFRNGTRPKGCSLVLILAVCLTFPALAKEAVLSEVGLSFNIAQDWFHDVEESTTSRGRLVQRWGHKPLLYGGKRYMPEIIVWAVPLKDDAELLDLTKDTLDKPPFETRLGVAECLKCVTAFLPRRGTVWLPRVGPTKAFAPAISYKDWVDCEPGKVADYHGSCIFERVNSVSLNVEPSWVFRFQKKVESEEMDVIVINLISDNKLVVMSFWYPRAMREQLTTEICSAITSIRVRDADGVG